jgi:hypothetical protein
VTKLGDEARTLVEAGRNTLRPSQEDRERILGALRERIAHSSAPVGEQAPSAAVKSGLGRAASTGLFAGAALVGALLWQLGQPASPPGAVLSRALSISSVLSARVVPPRPSEPAPSASGAAPSVSPEAARGAAPRSPSGRLAEEVALLSRAESELHAGRFAKALLLLDDYERRFPKGALTQEDVAARVQALCGLGRAAAAKAQLKRLAPGSPHASRARAACGNERLE